MQLRLSLLIFAWIISETESFCPKHPVAASLVQGKQTKSFRRSPIILFGEDEDNEEDEASTTERKKSRVPFFGRIARSIKRKSSNEDNAMQTTTEALTVEATKPSPVSSSSDPAEIAKSLRQQAERARLEAERMDAELTLQKIESLEGQLNKAKSKGETVENLQEQLDNLQAKLRGEQPKPQIIAPKVSEELPKVEPKMVEPIFQESQTKVANPVFGSEDFESTKKDVEESPPFLLKIYATLVECDFDSIDDINATQVAERITMMHNADFSFSNRPAPAFTQAEIDERIENQSLSDIPKNFIELAGGDVAKLAKYSLEFDYYIKSRLESDDAAKDIIMKAGEGEEWMKPLLEAINQTAVDRSIETLYPKCMRKEGVVEPTSAQVQSLFGTVLPQAKFNPSAKPEKVLGGYVIRGTHSYENGDKLIEAIDKELSRSNLDDKMNVLLAPDFTIFARSEEDDFDLDLFNPEDLQPILYVTAPDIARERQRVALSLTSGLGLATSWYLSIYPFLLNPDISKRVEGQLELADASMGYDLNWLTDLSVPLFVSFLGIQLAHEAAHRLVAANYDVSKR